MADLRHISHVAAELLGLIQPERETLVSYTLEYAPRGTQGWFPGSLEWTSANRASVLLNLSVARAMSPELDWRAVKVTHIKEVIR